VSSGQPGLLRLLWRIAGDWAYAILAGLSKPTAAERERGEQEPPAG
jgi:hypothetical protein